MTNVQIKVEEKENTSGVLNLSVTSNEAIMISNLPLLFADGYPTCLEKFTLRQIQKFVPFMLQCSMGQSYLDKYTPAPKWWPEDLPFSVRVERPSDLDEGRWFATLKSMVCRCYTYHGCEFMLRFCTELSDCPISTYRFVESWDGTTSLYNKETGRLMVTFRNENREYDKEVETSPRRSLLPKNSTQNSSRLMVQPPTFDIYLCDNCDGEFDSLVEVQEHERTCGRQDEDQDQDHEEDEDPDPDPNPDLPELLPEVPPKEPNKEAFLQYLSLMNVEKEQRPECKSPAKQPKHRRRYPRGLTFARCCSVPFSSPLGIQIKQIARATTVKPQMLINRMERHCVTKLRGLRSRIREQRENEAKDKDAPEWPITYKPPHPKKSQDNWNHYYCFSEKERRERIASRLAGGLNWRSRKLLSMCREVRVLVRRLTEEEIFYMTMRVQTPEPSTTFQLPTLLPNTMYTYHTNMNCKSGYPQEIEVLQSPSIEFFPDPTIPVIDLVSTDDEDDNLNGVSVPQISFVHSLHGIEEDEQAYCDKNASPDLTVYPFLETSSFEVETPVEYGTSSSVAQSWQMNICIKSPSPPSQNPPHIAYTEQHCSFQNKQKLQLSPDIQVYEHNIDDIVGTELLSCSSANDDKQCELQNFTGNRKMQTKDDVTVTPFEITSVTSCNLSVNTRSSKLSFSQQKKDLVGQSASSPDRCDIVEILDSSKISNRRKRCHTSTSRDHCHRKNTSPSPAVCFQKEKVKSNVYTDINDVTIENITVPKQGFQNKVINCNPPSLTPAPKLQKSGAKINSTPPSLIPAPMLQRSAFSGPLDSQETQISKVSSAQKLAVAQSEHETHKCDSCSEPDSCHSRLSSMRRRENKRLATKKTPVAVEIILDDDDDDEEEEEESPPCKKPSLKIYESAVPTVGSTTQDDDCVVETSSGEEGSLSYYCTGTRPKPSAEIVLSF